MRKLEGENSQTAVGVTCATLPTSSSACMILLIRATGNFVFTSIPSSTPGADFSHAGSTFCFLILRPEPPLERSGIHSASAFLDRPEDWPLRGAGRASYEDEWPCAL